MNVPVPNGSAVDLVCWHERKVTVTAINEVVRTAIAAQWKGIMDYETEPIVSSDIAHSSFSVHVRLAGHDGPRRERLQDALVVRRGLGLCPPRRGAPRSLPGPGPGGLPMSRVAINGFGRIGRTVLPHRQRPEGHRGRRHQRPLRQRPARLPPEVRHGDGRLREGRAGRRRRHDGGRPPRPDDGGEGPREAPVGEAGRGRRRGGDGKDRHAREAAEAPGRRSEEGDPDGAAQGRDRRDGRRGRERRHAAQGAPHRLERLLHDELPRAPREDPGRGLRHPGRLHDDGSRLHERPAPRGRGSQGPPPRARGRGEHHPDDDGRRTCRGEGPAVSEGKAGRYGDTRSRAGRLGRRPLVPPREEAVGERTSTPR